MQKMTLPYMKRIHDFRNLPKMVQKSNTWFAQRRRSITASSVSVFFDKNSIDFKNKIIEKVTGKSSFAGNSATRFGEMFEPVAREVYQYLCPEYVEEFGMITNDKYPCMAASPDGVTGSNKLLEIKCVSTRTITGVIPSKYYHQMQMQMFICDCEQCDYLECKFEEITKPQFKELYDIVRHASDDFLCICEVRPDEVLLYMNGDPNTVKNIANSKYSGLYKATNVPRAIIVPTIRTDEWLGKYFKLNVLSLQTVERNDKWMEIHKPQLEYAASFLQKCFDDSQFFTEYCADHPNNLVDGGLNGST